MPSEKEIRFKLKQFADFYQDKVCTFFDSLYASSRLGISLSGLLIIGY